MTFFANLKQPFLEIPEDGRIATNTFVDAIKSTLHVLDLLGPGAFQKIKSKATDNATKLEKRYETDKEKYATLQSIIETEKEEGKEKEKDSLTLSLLMLKRISTFIQAIFEEVLTMHPHLGESVSKAYERTIKQYHGWLIQKAFGLALRGVVAREKFMTALGNGASEDDVLKEMKVHSELMGKNVTVIHEFYDKMGIDQHGKV
ncbi:glycolipid transfer protein-like [Rhopilema esculentum]|uniref:glycolipid transfer protein-like n=1 Tax=Rhopilema esculentum TaxID=499914 RepID=UPI0031CF2C38|eukprot:gene9050-16694_t